MLLAQEPVTPLRQIAQCVVAPAFEQHIALLGIIERLPFQGLALCCWCWLPA
jgi:hypothetical protein